MAFSCPRPCVDDSTIVLLQPPAKVISFAQVLGGYRLVENAPLLVLAIKGNSLCIKIDRDEYEKGLADCKKAPGGRLVLNKGYKPNIANDLISRFSTIWKTTNKLKMVSLGRGFYDFHLATSDDLRTVWASGTANIKPEALHLSQWKNDFNYYSDKQTHAQIWIHLIESAKEYWRECTLLKIAAAVGTPIDLDEPTTNRLFRIKK